MARLVSYDALAYSLSTPEEDSDNRIRLKKAQQLLQQIIKTRLTPRQRQVIIGYYFEKKTFRELGEELGINKSTVCRTAHRATEKIQDYLSLYRLR